MTNAFESLLIEDAKSQFDAAQLETTNYKIGDGSVIGDADNKRLGIWPVRFGNSPSSIWIKESELSAIGRDECCCDEVEALRDLHTGPQSEIHC